jgi:hypothetical protein
VTVSTIAKPQVGPIFSEPKSTDHGNPLTSDIGSVATNVLGRPTILRDKGPGARRISADKANGSQDDGTEPIGQIAGGTDACD